MGCKKLVPVLLCWLTVLAAFLTSCSNSAGGRQGSIPTDGQHQPPGEESPQGVLSDLQFWVTHFHRVAHLVAGGLAARLGADATNEAAGTSHFVVVDREGNVASMTTTVESLFGSGRAVDGFFLNNQLTDFSFRPTENGQPVANAVAPGKRPRSSMSRMVKTSIPARRTFSFSLSSMSRMPTRTQFSGATLGEKLKMLAFK